LAERLREPCQNINLKDATDLMSGTGLGGLFSRKQSALKNLTLCGISERKEGVKESHVRLFGEV
jgi:hypothetical protein